MKKLKPILIMLLPTVFLFGCSANAKYEKDKVMIKKGYLAIKDILRDPESMIVYDCHGWTGQSENQITAEFKAKQNNSDEEFPDDIFITYYHIGARNVFGGMAEEEYIITFDLDSGEFKSAGSKSDLDAIIAGDDSIDVDQDVKGAYINIGFWDAFGWPDTTTDYKEFINSKEFEKIDVSKN